MGLKIIDSSKTCAVIQDTSPTQPLLDPAMVASALGAEPIPLAPTLDPLPASHSPITLFHVRMELFRRLLSTGGRPGLSGTDRRAKVPLSDQQWQDLEKMVVSLSSTGLNASPGQVASVLLTLAIDWAKKNGLSATAFARHVKDNEP